MHSISQHDGKATMPNCSAPYDAHDQLIEETLYDPQGQPTRDEDGYVTARFTYDPRGYQD